MSDDDSNPFRKLAEEFARRAGKRPASGASSLLAGGRAPLSGAREKGEEETAEADAALFFDAVSRIKALDRKKRRGRSTLAEIIAAKMKNEEDANPFIRKGEVQQNNGASDSFDAILPSKNTAMDRNGCCPPGAPASVKPGADEACNRRREESFADMLASLDRNKADQQDMSQEDISLFAKAMQGVRPVYGKGRDIPASSAPAARTAAQDPAKALRDILEGRVEFALHHSDEYMEGFVMGVDPLALARLRGGQFSPEAHVDLHGMNSRQAFDALVFFVKNAYLRGLRTVVIVTGRGKNSPDGIGVLRGLLQRWLSRDPLKRVVLAFCTAKPHDGGPGAVYVLLRKYKKSRGKIIWEYKPSDDEFL